MSRDTPGVYRLGVLVLAFFCSSAAWAQVDTGALGPLQGSLVTSLDVTGLKHTKPFVVSREIETTVGRPLQLDVLAADLRRLDNPPIPPVTTRELLIIGALATLVLRESVQLRAAGRLADETYSDLTDQVNWQSSNPQACEVSKAGLLTAVGAGVATISAEAGSITARAPVACGYVLVPAVHENPPTASVPLENVRVEVLGGPLAGQSFATGADGRVSLPPVAAPGFSLRFKKAGYEDFAYEVTENYAAVASSSTGCGAGTWAGSSMSYIPFTTRREGRIRTTLEGSAAVHLLDGAKAHVAGYVLSSTALGNVHSIDRILPAGSYYFELFCWSGAWRVTVLRPE